MSVSFIINLLALAVFIGIAVYLLFPTVVGAIIRRHPPDGVNVSKGRNGLHGRDGEDSPDPVHGADGAPGMDARPAFDGNDGRNGLDGSTGRRGPTGHRGDPGEKGDPGLPGPQRIEVKIPGGDVVYYVNGEVDTDVAEHIDPVHARKDDLKRRLGELGMKTADVDFFRGLVNAIDLTGTPSADPTVLDSYDKIESFIDDFITNEKSATNAYHLATQTYREAVDTAKRDRALLLEEAEEDNKRLQDPTFVTSIRSAAVASLDPSNTTAPYIGDYTTDPGVDLSVIVASLRGDHELRDIHNLLVKIMNRVEGDFAHLRAAIALALRDGSVTPSLPGGFTLSLYVGGEEGVRDVLSTAKSAYNTASTAYDKFIDDFISPYKTINT